MFPFKGLCQQVGSQVYFCNTHGTRICMYCDIRLLFGFRSQSILVLFSQLSFPECMTRLISPCLTDRSKGAGSVHKGRQGFPPIRFALHLAHISHKQTTHLKTSAKWSTLLRKHAGFVSLQSSNSSSFVSVLSLYLLFLAPICRLLPRSVVGW